MRRRFDPAQNLRGFLEGAPTLLVAGCAALYHLALYGFANRFPSRPAAVFTQRWLDQAMPLWPWTVWVYLSAHLVVLTAFWLTRAPGARTRFAAAFAVAIALSAFVHWAWPVRFPRELFPLQGGGPAVAVLAGLRAVDHAGSAIPSLHVAMVALAALQLARDRNRWAPAIALWALAVTVSTLTTKQHYAVDAVAGVALAAAVDWAVAAVLARGQRRALA